MSVGFGPIFESVSRQAGCIRKTTLSPGGFNTALWQHATDAPAPLRATACRAIANAAATAPIWNFRHCELRHTPPWAR
jgi:hypothetical protein